MFHKHLITGFLIVTVSLLFTGQVHALDSATAVQVYGQELISLGLEEDAAMSKAAADVKAVVDRMESMKNEVKRSFETLEDRVDNLPRNDEREDAAESALESLEGLIGELNAMNPAQNLYVQKSIAGALPQVEPGTDYILAKEAVDAKLSELNRILIAPARPGNVPTGDLVSDFIPQLIRQLFRFAWLAVFISFTVSGVLFVTAQENDERLTKAKSMIYFTLVGFAMVALAFAIVKAVTDIDFFRFI